MIGTVRTLAAAHTLTADRLRPTFLVLRTNTRFWSRSPLPASGLAHEPGHRPRDLPVLPRARPAAPAAGELGPRERDRRRLPGGDAQPHEARTAAARARWPSSLDRLSALGARRSGYLAWEYYFAYGTGSPPWVSGMAQATAIQALSRGYRAIGKARWRRSGAERALGAFEQAPPTGVSVRAPGGRHYLLYSFAPSTCVFNGGLQAVIGLRDAAALLHSKRAERLFERGERAARREVAEYDTGAWSLYSEHGAEATLNYHSLIAGFLDDLCDRVHRRRLLQRRQALRALRARADEDRPRAAAQGPLGPREHDPLLDLEDLDREGADLGHARDEPLARPASSRAARTRCPGARRAAAATRCGSGAGPERAARRREAHDPDHAAQAEAEEEEKRSRGRGRGRRSRRRDAASGRKP